MAVAIEDRVGARAAVSCPACGGGEAARHLTHRRGVYVACAGCGLVRSEPLPGPDHVRARADHWAHRQNLAEEKLARAFDPAHQRLAYDPVLERLERLRGGGGRLLEVGCAAGGLLDAALRRGWTATGVELAAEVARWAREERGLDVRHGTVETVPLEPASFDAAVMLDVIEHVADPLSLLRRVADLLRPGGAVVVMTPNRKGVGSRVLGGDWEACDPIDHLWLFDPRTLAALCRRAGLRPGRRWCIDVNPIQLLSSLRRRRGTERAAAAGPSPAPQPSAAARRNRLARRISRSPLLRLGRAALNALLSPLDLGDKLYLLAVKE